MRKLEEAAPGRVAFTLNGRPVRADPEEGQSALDLLRERFGITSLKDACSPQGQCGCCMALVDGAPKTTCAMPAERLEGREVVTLEGLSEAERKLIADAFQSAAGLQCGFCTPGLALRAKWLTDGDRELSRAEIAKGLDGHLCRCTGYVKIVDAVLLIHRARRGGEAPRFEPDGGVGKAAARHQGTELTLGARPYIADMVRAGMLHGAVVLSPLARARVVRVDASAARKLPGVVRVATAADVPGDRWVGQIYRD
jgi:aerobic-type carbon monoxide dehydrogenase small subunit (CoxS/CutS family)